MEETRLTLTNPAHHEQVYSSPRSTWRVGRILSEKQRHSAGPRFHHQEEDA